MSSRRLSLNPMRMGSFRSSRRKSSTTKDPVQFVTNEATTVPDQATQDVEALISSVAAMDSPKAAPESTQPPEESQPDSPKQKAPVVLARRISSCTEVRLQTWTLPSEILWSPLLLPPGT